MSILDRLNRRIAARIHGDRSKVVVDGEQLALLSARGREQLPLAELTAATLSHRDVYSGDAVVLRLGFTGGRSVEVFQDDPCWCDLMAALDRTGAIHVPSAEWQLRFLSAGDGAAPIDLMGAAHR